MSKHGLGDALARAVDRERLNEQDPLPPEVVARVSAIYLRAVNSMSRPHLPRTSDMLECIIIRSQDDWTPTRYRLSARSE